MTIKVLVVDDSALVRKLLSVMLDRAAGIKVVGTANDPYAARENLQRIEHPGVGEGVVPAAVPRLTATPARLRRLGRAMGFDTDAVFEELLSLSAERVAELRGQGVV